MYIDSHCHLDRLDLSPYNGDLAAAIDAARQAGVKEMLCIGIDLDNAATVVDIAGQYDGVYATVGVHPLDVAETAANLDTLEQLAADPRVLAIGETGLDYHYAEATAEVQRESFRRHLALAARIDKPVVVHSRDAREDTLEQLADYSAHSQRGGVLHCFTETWDMASRALDMGFYISFSGIITFRNADALREVVKKVPLDRMLIETDSPYLAPVPHRGKKNEPKYVVEVAKCAAELKGVSVEALADITADNFHRLFL